MEFLYTGVTAVSCSDIKDISKIAFKFQVNNWLAVFQTEEMALMENNKPASSSNKRNKGYYYCTKK